MINNLQVKTMDKARATMVQGKDRQSKRKTLKRKNEKEDGQRQDKMIKLSKRG